MGLEFPKINLAINWTIDYYKIYRIKDEFELIGNKGYGGANSKQVQAYYDTAMKLHKGMEDEITQTIQNCYPSTQILLIDYLDSWLEDFRIKETNSNEIYYTIENYNNEIQEEFSKEVEEKEAEFKSTFHYQLDHGAEYEIEGFVSTNLFLGFVPSPGNKLHLRKNNKFFCLDRSPEYIDLEFFNEYINRLDKLVSSFRRVLKKYTDLYKAGKLPINHAVILSTPIVEPELKMLPQPLNKIQKKLKTTLTVPQIGFLFKMLHEDGIIESKTYTEIQMFISNNFIAGSKGEDEGISSTKLKKLWSDFDIKTASFWDDKFIDLHNLSKKYNPNNIKTKR